VKPAALDGKKNVVISGLYRAPMLLLRRRAVCARGHMAFAWTAQPRAAGPDPDPDPVADSAFAGLRRAPRR
jgi:hypothetical protein